MPSNNLDIYQNINSDTVIGFTSQKDMKTKGWLDASKVSTYLMDDDDESYRKHLGMINLFNTTHNVSVPFMKDLFENASVLEVDEGESVTYDLPVNREKIRCYTAEDTSNYTDYPGIAGSYFKIILSQELSPGDSLTYDPVYGEQAIVSNEHDINRVGDNFEHWVQMQTNDQNKWFPKEQLQAGIEWIKSGTTQAEYDTEFSGINLTQNSGGSIRCEFILGSPRATETFVTRKAHNMKSDGLTRMTSDMKENVDRQYETMGGKNKDMFFVARKTKDGKSIVKDTMKIGSTLEYLSLLELSKLEAYELLFAKPASIETSNGLKRINEGVWHQLRRGKIIEYAQPGGITIDHIHEATAYVYKNTGIPPEQRVMKFKAGYFAYQNVLQIFREEAVSQLGALPQGMLGTDSQIKDPVFKGNLGNLEMQAVQIKSVTIPGIGKVEVEHDESLDYQPMTDRFSSGMYGQGKANTSYSLVMWDVTNPKYSNVNDKVKNAELVKGGSNTSNIYYVKPKGSHVTYGYRQGRMANEESFENVHATMKHMGKEFWAISQSSALVLDSTRFVTIEKQRPR